MELLSNGPDRSIAPLATPEDFSSATWQKLAAFLERRRQELREQNDLPQTAEQTAFLRGQISEVTFTLALPEFMKRAGQAPIEPGDISAFY